MQFTHHLYEFVILQNVLDPAELIKLAGFAAVSPRIPSVIRAASPPLRGQRTVYLVTPDGAGDVSTFDVGRLFEEHRLEPLNVLDLIAFAASHPDLMMKRNVCALGDVDLAKPQDALVASASLKTARTLRCGPIRYEPWWTPLLTAFLCRKRVP